MENTKYIKRIEVKKPQLEIANEIIDMVNHYYQTELIKKTRKRLFSLPRQISQYLIRYYCDKLGYQDIALITGITNHATVINSLNRIDDYLEFDKEVRTDVLFLKSEINAKIDLTQTSKSAIKKKEMQLQQLKEKMLTLEDTKYFDLLDTINNHLNNYSKWSV